MTESLVQDIAKTLNPIAFQPKPTDPAYYAFKPKGQSHELSDADWWQGNEDARKVATNRARRVVAMLDAQTVSQARDADRWRALLSAGRLRWIGSAGFDHTSIPANNEVKNLIGAKARPEGQLHFGMEVWDEYGANDTDMQAALQKPNCHMRSVLTAFADETIRRKSL